MTGDESGIIIKKQKTERKWGSVKKTVLFGAGQIGTMLFRLLSGEYQAVCFADNAEGKWGRDLLGIPICSPSESLKMHPDCVCLCVLDAERSEQMRAQMKSLGFEGEVLTPDALKIFDVRTATMRLLAEQIRQEGIPGDAAELGVYRGEFAAHIHAALPDRYIHLFDTFEGFQRQDVALEAAEKLSRAKTGDFSETSVELVRSRLPYPETAVFHKGWFPESFAGCEKLRFSIVSIDADLYAPTAAALPIFWERLSPGGVLLIHDVNSTQFSGTGKAVREFCSEEGIYPLPVCDLHGSVILQKPGKYQDKEESGHDS